MWHAVAEPSAVPRDALWVSYLLLTCRTAHQPWHRQARNVVDDTDKDWFR